MKTRIFVICSGVLLSVSACAQVQPREAFPEVQASASERSTVEVEWHGDPENASELKARVAAILGDELTEDNAVRIALINNRRLQTTFESLGVSQAAMVQAGLISNPVFDAVVFSTAGGHAGDYGWGISQSVLDILYAPMRKAVAIEEHEKSKLMVVSEIVDLAARARSAYYRVQAATQEVEMFEQAAAATSASLEAAREINAAGNSTRLDLKSEELLREQTRLMLAEAILRRDEVREELSQLMGLWGDDIHWSVTTRLADPAALPHEWTEEIESFENMIVAKSLDLAIKKREIDKLGKKLGLTETSRLFPDASLGVEVEREEGEQDVGPTVAVPLPIFDQGQARVASANAELRRELNSYYALAVEVRSAARRHLNRLVQAHRMAEFQRNVILPIAGQILEESQLQNNAMQIGVFQLLETKRRQLEEGRRYIERLEAYWLAKNDLDLLASGRMPGERKTMEKMEAGPDEPSGKGGH